MVEVPEPTAKEIQFLAAAIARGEVYSALCLPAANHRLALLAPPAMFGARELEHYCIFAVYGLNKIVTTQTPWGGIDQWETCKIWPRAVFMAAVTLAEQLANAVPATQ